MSTAAGHIPASHPQRRRLRIEGAVQGVGFRPYVYALAQRHGVGGWIRNEPAGVTLEIEADDRRLDRFRRQLCKELPFPARIDRLRSRTIPATGATAFEIRASSDSGVHQAVVLPDLATCPACLRELFDPTDRRYRYPFINCSHCGPRWSLIERLPYDRGNTAMRYFIQCPACAAEYSNPADRRFHAQPNACPDCGPQLAYWDTQGTTLAERDGALQQAQTLLRDGGILAFKGLGGFQLMVDARNPAAIARLRRRKQRPHKPLAVMFADLQALQSACRVDSVALAALTSPAAPIVLLPHRGQLPASLAPGNPYLGAFLPCTPLHQLLLHDLNSPVVATSGNRAGEPLCSDEAEVLQRLDGIADAFLVHNRPIMHPVDDSVVQVCMDRLLFLRRARGYAPLTLKPATRGDAREPLLATGGHLKNCIALGNRERMVLGPHVGDLDNPQAMTVFDQRTQDMECLYHLPAAGVVHDLHPDYYGTQYAQRRGLPRQAVQHHHAHIVAGMVEHGLQGEVLGVAFDGNGYGADGSLWGGEFLLTRRDRFERLAQLRPLPLPGGEKAMQEPRRCALGLLYALYGDPVAAGADLPPLQSFEQGALPVLSGMLEKRLNCPPSSAAGRLFDAVAALLDLNQYSSFEGQAAMALQFAAEAVVNNEGPSYPFSLDCRSRPWILDWGPMLENLILDLRRGLPVACIAAGFHHTLAAMIAETAWAAGLPTAVLGGGCFQNRLLLQATVARLQARGIEVFWPDRLPPNDGGLAAGQLAVALARQARNNRFPDAQASVPQAGV